MEFNEETQRLAIIANRNGRSVYINPAHPDRVSTYYLPDNCAMFTGSLQSVIRYEEAERKHK